MKQRLMFVFFILMLCGSMRSFADVSYAGRKELGIFGGGIFFEGNSMTDEDWVYGARFGYNLNQHWGVEGALLTGKTQFQVPSSHGKAINSNNPMSKVDILLPTVDVLYHFGNSSFRPYVAAGLGLLRLEPDFNVTQHGAEAKSTNDLLLQYGAGFKFLLTNNLLVRLDARHMLNTDSAYHRFGASKHDAVVNVGFSWLFGMCGVTEHQVKVAPVEVKELAAGWELKGIHFVNNSHEIQTKSYAVLDAAALILKNNPTALIEIQGYTDNKGRAEKNRHLSEARALAVKEALVKKGIPANRLSTKGYGAEKPRADNNTEEGRAANRRIEFKVISR